MKAFYFRGSDIRGLEEGGLFVVRMMSHEINNTVGTVNSILDSQNPPSERFALLV
ncbi:MAG: hypothetical protein M3512_02840 [Bacteroidota bacterium]|nr:hypothetical protein [Bacteroidota bacterium]